MPLARSPRCWAALVLGAMLLAGCVSQPYAGVAYPGPYYAPAPRDPLYPRSPTPLYALPPDDAPAIVDTRPLRPMPPPDISVEPLPEPEPGVVEADPALDPMLTPAPSLPGATARDDAAPPGRAEPEPYVPLQGFRPMRGQSRPGL